MLNTIQARMSAIAPMCPFKGPMINSSDVGFRESARRSASFTYGGVSLFAQTNPFAIVATNVIINSSISSSETTSTTLSSQEDITDISDMYVLNGVNSSLVFTQFYYVDSELPVSGQVTINLQELPIHKLGINFIKDFHTVKSIEIVNSGTGNLFLSLTGANSLADKFGNATEIKIPSSGYYKKLDFEGILIEDDSNSFILKSDGAVEYQLLILGNKTWI